MVNCKSVFITINGVAFYTLECHTALTEWAFKSSNSTVAVKLEWLNSTNTCKLWRLISYIFCKSMESGTTCFISVTTEGMSLSQSLTLHFLVCLLDRTDEPPTLQTWWSVYTTSPAFRGFFSNYWLNRSIITAPYSAKKQQVVLEMDSSGAPVCADWEPVIKQSCQIGIFKYLNHVSIFLLSSLLWLGWMN